MTTKKRVAPQHKEGKRTGYTVCPDGSISLAPTHAQRIDEISAEDVAVSELLRHVTNHCTALLKKTSAARAAWFRSVADDLGIDLRRFNITWNQATQRLMVERLPPDGAEVKPAATPEEAP